MNNTPKPKMIRVKNISGSIQHVVPGRLVPPDGIVELNEAEAAVFGKGLDESSKRQRLFKATWQFVVAPENDSVVAIKREPEAAPAVETPPVVATRTTRTTR